MERNDGLRVCKFGGSSVANAGQMKKVKAIVDAEPTRRFVVPSAPGKRHSDDIKITDLLYRSHDAAAAGEALDPIFDQIADRYREIVRELGLDFDLDPALSEVHDRIRDGAGADYAASRGEYLSGVVLSKLLDRPLVDPASMIRFDASGRFLKDETQQAVADRLEKEEAGVIPGFYGALPDGSIKTFSRGGSDITGAIVARGVGAAVYENWTDVSGLLMTDPRIVDSPRTIAELTYRELRELAYMGATVLHDEAIFPVREAGIPVHIRNTNDPDATGTLITRGGLDGAADRTHHGHRRPQGLHDPRAREDADECGDRLRTKALLGVLEDHGISWEHIPSGIDTLSIVLKDDASADQLDSLSPRSAATCEPDSIEVNPGIALIATVGRGMSHAPGTAARLFRALADAGINIRMIDQGSSEMNIIVGVENADFERTVRAIYDAFVAA